MVWGGWARGRKRKRERVEERGRGRVGERGVSVLVFAVVCECVREQQRERESSRRRPWSCGNSLCQVTRMNDSCVIECITANGSWRKWNTALRTSQNTNMHASAYRVMSSLFCKRVLQRIEESWLYYYYYYSTIQCMDSLRQVSFAKKPYTDREIVNLQLWLLQHDTLRK